MNRTKHAQGTLPRGNWDEMTQPDPTCLFFMCCFLLSPFPEGWYSHQHVPALPGSLPSHCLPCSPTRCLWLLLTGIRNPPPILLSHRSQPIPSSPKHPEFPMQRRTTWWQRLDRPSAPSPLLPTALQPHSLPASPASTCLQTYLHVENISWCSSSGACVPVNLFHVSSLSWWSLFTQLPLVLLSPSHFTSQLGLCKQGNSHLDDLIGIRSVTPSVFFKCLSP